MAADPTAIPGAPHPPTLPDRPALPGPGDRVVAAGVGVTGLAVVRYLAGLGVGVVVTSNRPPARQGHR